MGAIPSKKKGLVFTRLTQPGGQRPCPCLVARPRKVKAGCVPWGPRPIQPSFREFPVVRPSRSTTGRLHSRCTSRKNLVGPPKFGRILVPHPGNVSCSKHRATCEGGGGQRRDGRPAKKKKRKNGEDTGQARHKARRRKGRRGKSMESPNNPKIKSRKPRYIRRSPRQKSAPLVVDMIRGQQGRAPARPSTACAHR